MENHAPKAVFLSYAREDAAAARRIAEALRSSGIEVWFDENELRGGDAWAQKIRRQIKECTLFVAIVSVHTQERGEGYFRLEWKLAVERMDLMAEGVPFLVPVVVDETSESSDMVPEPFLRVQWTRLLKGLPSPQFVEQVQRLLALPHKPATPTARAEAESHAPVPAGRSSFPMWPVVAVGVAGFALVAYVLTRPHEKAPAAPQKPTAEAKSTPAAPVVNDKSIAVLLFKNLSEDKDNNAFFADGIHEDILTKLAHIRELRVVSRTSVEQYADAKKPLRQIAQELGVAYVLEGSVRRAAGKVRVTGQLIRAATDEHLWAQDYTKDLTVADVFAIQSELAEKIVESLHVVLSPEEKKSLARLPTENIVAYDLYLKSRAERQNTATISKAYYLKRENLLQQAVALDPGFAPAWASLVWMHVGMYRSYYDRTDSRLAKAKTALDTAMRLAPDTPEVFGALGNFYSVIYHDYARAAAEFERAIRQRPNHSGSYANLSHIQRRQGRWHEVIANIRKSVQLDPGNFNESSALAANLEIARRYEEAVVARRRLVEMHPDDLKEVFGVAFVSFLASGATRDVEEFFAGLTAENRETRQVRLLRRTWADAQGNTAEAIHLDQLINPNGSTSLLSAAHYAAMGDLMTARSKLEKQPAELRTRLEQEPDRAAAWSTLGCVEALLGHKEEALRCARKAVELMPESRDSVDGPPMSVALAFVYAWTGDKDRAIKEYARLLRVPYAKLNVHVMRHHPYFFPLRGDPRFEALLNDPKNNAPLF